MELGVVFGKLLVAFLLIINPFSALSIYLVLTQNHSTKEKRSIARTAALAVFIVIIVFALSGGILLKVLGI
ncbi:MarC family protein, partial [Neisseria sp. P0001.S010]|uniref:MarC family protein n=1 Tax=Neisseria sp. P0001.S010 TaxID=3436654 RepID=UPI003F8236BD